MTHVLLAGNPNCGKTTLFNALTGENQRIGNWPGVTVEKKTGTFFINRQLIEVTDLPGVYSLAAYAEGASQDEKIAVQSLATLHADYVINVIDACHLERHLYLTSQLLELGKPLIVVLNMMDVAAERGISINTEALAQQLGCQVIPIQAHKKIGLSALEQTLAQNTATMSSWTLSLPSTTQNVLTQLEKALRTRGYSREHAYYYSRRFAEGDALLLQQDEMEDLIASILIDPGMDIVLADARYQKIHEIVAFVQTKRSDASEHFTAKLDKIVLNRFLALPLFFAMMYLMFLFAINIGGAFQDFFDISTDTVFVQGTAWLLQQIHTPNWVIAVLANGVGKGVNTMLTFTPVIAAMFFFLSLLETSGYMARAAFVVDKVMRLLGLPGKAFVPMIVGLGCNVPAIMAARTLDSEHDRLLTVMMSPFISCSARLAIYTVFVAAFFPSGGQNVVFALYLFGILMAVLTGFVLRKSLLKGQASPLILELPAYHRPALKRLLKETLTRLRFFVLRAGKLIVPICVLLGGLNAITLGGEINSSEAHAQSLLSLIGQFLTPVFAPMGIHQDNWPATVGLLTGMLAKEVVVGTLNSLYAQVGHVGETAAAHFDFWAGMKAALWSIPENLSQLGAVFINPIRASAAESSVAQSVYGIMAQRFDGRIGAFAYLLFVLLYIPCVSTMAVIRQEANKKLMWISVFWSFFVAYVSAVVFYQSAKWLSHSPRNLLWYSAFLCCTLFFIVVYQAYQRNVRRAYAVANT